MVPHATQEQGGEPAEVGEKGFATLDQLIVGVKAIVEKNGEKRRAEILSIQTRKGVTTFYVHYEDFNKRLDEWVTGDRIDLEEEVEWPVPEKPDSNKDKSGQTKATPSIKSEGDKKHPKNMKRGTSLLDREMSGTPEASSANLRGKTPRPSKASGKENRESTVIVSTEVLDGTPQPDDEQANIVDVQDAAAAAKAAPSKLLTREEEIERLRVSGSMTQNQAEISRVRNLRLIQMGNHEMEPWYFSPYPKEFVDVDMVYICEFCLLFYGEYKQFSRHRSKCTLLHPPGNEIYRDDNVSFFEIDGRRQRTWCRNLCLFSKLFLDHKTVYHDVDPFLFYCMTTRDEHGCHLVGYFSKEKESMEGFNVACILTLPQYQRKGFGKLLIAFSYELSKRENKLGSPEKPLSDLGLLSYRAYWQEVIVDLLLDRKERGGGSVSERSVEELSTLTAMTTNDVLHTLQNLNTLRFARNQHYIVLNDAIVEQRERQKEKEKVKGKRAIDPEKLIWKPPVFTASSRTWNW